MRLPDFVVIGAMKAGTTSLARYLDLHPEIGTTDPKELDFFVAERNWSRGVDWYGGHFSPSLPVVGEVSPNYTKHPEFEGVAERMARVIPDARLVYVLRDPVERLVSHYRHELLRSRVRAPLDDVVRHDHRYVDASRYALQIEEYLRHFDRAQLLVVRAEDLRSQRRQTVAEIVAFVGADPARLPADLDFEEHGTEQQRGASPLGRRLQGVPGYRTVRRLVPGALVHAGRRFTTRTGSDLDPSWWRLSDETRSWLAEVYTADQARLATLLGHDPLTRPERPGLDTEPAPPAGS